MLLTIICIVIIALTYFVALRNIKYTNAINSKLRKQIVPSDENDAFLWAVLSGASLYLINVIIYHLTGVESNYTVLALTTVIALAVNVFSVVCTTRK